MPPCSPAATPSAKKKANCCPHSKYPFVNFLITINSNGSTVTRLDVETRLPDGRLLYEAYGDIGGSIEEALSANWDNFEKSALNVMLDAFNQTGGAENWTLDGLPFAAYIGKPTLKFVGGKPQYPTEPLVGAVKEALKRTRIGNAIHFVRFYYCQINGETESVEFMLDNQNLPFAEQALSRLDWPKREAFYSLRLFLILIPGKAV